MIYDIHSCNEKCDEFWERTNCLNMRLRWDLPFKLWSILSWETENLMRGRRWSIEEGENMDEWIVRQILWNLSS